MFQYTADNHHRWWIDGQQWQWHERSDHTLDFAHGKVNPQTVSDFRTEINRTVEAIMSRISHVPLVTFSGGVDGEIILRGFMECGYKVQPVTLVYPYGINEYDLGFARSFCRDAGLKPIEIEADVMSFWSRGIYDYCDRYRLPPWICTTKAWLADVVDGFLIQAHGWPTVAVHDDRVVIEETSHNLNPLLLTGKQGIGDFFKYRPELTYSWLNDVDIYRWCRTCKQTYESLDSQRWFKFFALSKYYENDSIPLKPREKRSGHERLGSFIAKPMRELKDRYQSNVKTVSWEYDGFLSNMRNV